MGVVEVRIHPAIGIARVGNSPEGHFIGPERRWDRSAPEDGSYKDGSGRIKRQVARFRLFAYDERGVPSELVEGPGVEITWTVHLVNAKAAARLFRPDSTRNRSYSRDALGDLVIDPGPRTVDRRRRRAEFDTGEFTLRGRRPQRVPLGEIRLDDEGRLLVFGGAGAAGSPAGTPLSVQDDSDDWYDDIADGPVEATVRINGTEHPVAGSWVISAPPKFAPPVGNAIRLWDALFDALATGQQKSAPPSYVDDIYPILQAAIDSGAVAAVARRHHRFRHPVPPSGQTAGQILRFVEQLDGRWHMPRLASGRGDALDLPLTPTQKQRMQAWVARKPDPAWDAAWVDGPPVADAVTPDGMDKAALENCVGGALRPGIEAGELLLDPARYGPIETPNGQPSFRLDHARVEPGEVTAGMSLPWQADFHACNPLWWPAPRPGQVVPAGSPPGAEPVQWNRGYSRPVFVAGGWTRMGFVTRQDEGLVETDGETQNR
ncbi:LodA/GoxA family CTQ-dependent oxidase [Amycolatopsis sp. NPDC005961]|uniref:LodA/GoxA family CTQ-dependent oxidase n=1 Tax=Amycolatopsis sp. NPDC005961 TaxID=3156720 RepID=UPI003404C51F